MRTIVCPQTAAGHRRTRSVEICRDQDGMEYEFKNTGRGKCQHGPTADCDVPRHCIAPSRCTHGKRPPPTAEPARGLVIQCGGEQMYTVFPCCQTRCPETLFGSRYPTASPLAELRCLPSLTAQASYEWRIQAFEDTAELAVYTLRRQL